MRNVASQSLSHGKDLFNVFGKGGKAGKLAEYLSGQEARRIMKEEMIPGANTCALRGLDDSKIIRA